MAFSDNDDNNDDINEYQTGSDSDSWSDEDEKVQLLTKKQKQINAFQGYVRAAVLHFHNSEFLNFQQDLKAINDGIIKFKWSAPSYKMPKFFVKHMLAIYNKLKEIDPKNEKNKKEQRALKSLKKNFEKDLRHFKQLQVFASRPTHWKDEDSDLGQMENDEDIDEDSDDDALYSLQDTTKTSKEDKDDDEDSEEKDDDDDGDSDDDDSEDEDSEDDFEDEWSSYSQRGQDDSDADDGSDDDFDDDDDDDADGGDKGDEMQDWLKGFDEEEIAQMRQRSFWVKKTIRRKPKKDGKSKKEKKKKEKKEKKTASAVDGDEEKESKSKEKKAKKAGVSQWSVGKVRDMFTYVLQNKGKSTVNREEIVSRLESLIVQCGLYKADQSQLTVISVLVSFYFDTASRKTTGMSGSRWRKTQTLISTMIRTLSKNYKKMRMSNDADIRLNLFESEKDEVTNEENQANVDWMNDLDAVDGGGGDGNDQSIRPKAKKEDKFKRLTSDLGGFSVINMNKKKQLDPNFEWVYGNLLAFIKKLSVQLFANLKSLSGKTDIYEKSMKKNTDLLIKIYKKACSYYGRLQDTECQSEIEVLWMSVIHNDYDEKLDELKEQIDAKKDSKELSEKEKAKNKKKKLSLSMKGKGEKILKLPKCALVKKAIFIFEHGSTRNQTQAMLYLIYGMALHHRYALCKNLLLMSHLGSSTKIGNANIELQILYNRALAQYALCSFCNGYWYSAMIILQEMFSSKQIKILLAQGFVAAPLENAPAELIKQEQAQQARMLPPHFHINHDLLEAAHLLSSLFIEIPNMINNSYNKSFIRNQYFRQIWHRYLRRDLRVPPENTKDKILTTGISMQNGEYVTCKKMINSLKLWDNLKHPRFVKKKVFSMIKRECLRCYLYRYGSVYHSISIERLSEMFSMSQNHTKQFIAKLIITAGNDSKFASLDEMTGCVVIHQSPPMPIQRTALEYSDKLSFLIEQNEKLLGIYSRFGRGQSGGSGAKWKGGKDGDQSGGQKSAPAKEKVGFKRSGRFNRTGASSSSGANKSSQPQFGRGQQNRVRLG